MFFVKRTGAGFKYRFNSACAPLVEKRALKEMDVIQFLNAPCAINEHDVKSVKLHPIIGQMFLMYNTPITSSAPVERLFSYGGVCSDYHMFPIRTFFMLWFFSGLILEPHRDRLGDILFEEMLILRSNQFTSQK